MSIISFSTLFLLFVLFCLTLLTAERLGNPVATDSFHGEAELIFVSHFDCVPVKHNLAILFDNDSCNLANDKQFEHVNRQGQNEQEFNLLACLLVLKVESFFVRGKHHRGEHLQDRRLQVTETLQLVAPSIGDHIGEHDGESPPKTAEKHDQAANVRDNSQCALNIRQELEEWDQEDNEKDKVTGLDIVQHLETIDKRCVVNDVVRLSQDFLRRCLLVDEVKLHDEESHTE